VGAHLLQHHDFEPFLSAIRHVDRRTQLQTVNSRMSTAPKQVPDSLVVDRHVQIRRRDADVRVPGGVADFSQCPSSRQRVADERVPAVVDRQRLVSGRFPTSISSELTHSVGLLSRIELPA
jgi:hypothetical protein